MMKNSQLTGVDNTKVRYGIAMMLVLFAVAAATILSLTFINTQSTSTTVASNILDHAAAQSIAESGLQMVVEEIRKNADWREKVDSEQWIANMSLNGGKFSITVTDGVDMDGDGVADGDGDISDNDSDPLTITAVGEIDGVTHTVKAIAMPVLTRDRKVVFVVPAGQGLSAQDLLRKEMIENFKWQVDTISATDTPDNFAQMIKDAHVAFISSSVNPGILGRKLRGVKKGVVSEQLNNYVDMGVANDNATTYTSTDIKVSDSGHYITKTMDDGSVQVFSSSQSMAATDAANITGGDVLGEKTVGSGASLVVSDTGDTDSEGQYIEGRRVWLPWGGDNLDVSEMTDSGKELFERAIDWAGRQAGTGSTEVGIVVNEYIELSSDAYIDSYDSKRGPYNDTYNNADQAVVVSDSDDNNAIILKENAQIKGEVFLTSTADPSSTIIINDDATITGEVLVQDGLTGMPEVTIPEDVPASSGDIELGPYSYSLNRDYHANAFIMGYKSNLYISGHITMVCDDQFYMKDYTRLFIYPNSSLTIYTPHFEANGYYIQANTSYGDPGQLNVYITGDKQFELEKAARVCANVYAPMGEMEIESHSEFYGTFIGNRLIIEDSAAFHQDIKEVQKPLPPLRYELTVVWEEGM